MHIQSVAKVPKIGRAHQDAILVWDEELSLGSVESIPVLHLVRQRWNTLQHVQHVAKQYGFERCWQDYSMQR